MGEEEKESSVQALLPVKATWAVGYVYVHHLKSKLQDQRSSWTPSKYMYNSLQGNIEKDTSVSIPFTPKQSWLHSQKQSTTGHQQNASKDNRTNGVCGPRDWVQRRHTLQKSEVDCPEDMGCTHRPQQNELQKQKPQTSASTQELQLTKTMLRCKYKAVSVQEVTRHQMPTYRDRSHPEGKSEAPLTSHPRSCLRRAKWGTGIQQTWYLLLAHFREQKSRD